MHNRYDCNAFMEITRRLVSSIKNLKSIDAPKTIQYAHIRIVVKSSLAADRSLRTRRVYKCASKNKRKRGAQTERASAGYFRLHPPLRVFLFSRSRSRRPSPPNISHISVTLLLSDYTRYLHSSLSPPRYCTQIDSLSLSLSCTWFDSPSFVSRASPSRSHFFTPSGRLVDMYARFSVSAYSRVFIFARSISLSFSLCDGFVATRVPQTPLPPHIYIEARRRRRTSG